jgi:hypothetical protein
MKSSFWTFILIGVAGTSNAFAQTADCRLILQGGAFDSTYVQMNKDSTVKLVQAMCSQYSQSGKLSAGLSFASLFGGNLESEDQIRSKICSSSNFSYEGHQADLTKVQAASKVLVDGFKECISSGHPGLYVAYGTTANPKEFVLRLGFVPVAKNVTSATISVQNAEEAGCPQKYVPPSLFSGESTSVGCMRPTNDAITLILTSPDVMRTNDTISLPPIPTPPPCDQKESANPINGLAAIAPSACTRALRYQLTGSFKRGVCNSSVVSDTKVRLKFNNIPIATWSDTNFSNNSPISGGSTKGTVSLNPGEQGIFEVAVLTSICSDPVDPVAVNVWPSDVPSPH